MFTSIVVGTDGSSTARGAVQKAAELAKASGGRLHVVSAYRLPTQAMMAAPASEALAFAGGSSDAEVHAEVEAMLRALGKELANDGIDVETYACPHPAAQAILDVAAHQQADLIVVGNRGMRGARRLLGSVPNTIAHQASCSVLIVPTC
jgi:nucleotide-binding universal stress UspA family protein